MMPPGADRVILFDPPGAIGLVDLAPVLLLRFDETDTTTRPQDEHQVCQDFDTVTDATTMPVLVDAVIGRGRQFGAGAGLAAADVAPGATLLARDMSIQVVLSWDAVAQQAVATPGVIIARGRGGSSAEFVCYGVRIDVVDAAASVGLVRWFWQDVAGVDHVDVGAQVTFPEDGFTLLTVTRRWVSPNNVALSYYVGNQLAGQVTNAAGSIGGGTTGTVQLGYRSVSGVPTQFLAGVVDELLVLDRELCAEEIEAAWLRITVYQPLGVQLFREMFDQDFPVSAEPDADVQLDIRMTGQALGFAAAKIEEMRANFVPQRSYGTVLADWEAGFQSSPQQPQGLSIPARRERVLAKARQQSGSSTDGLRDILAGLLGGADVSQLRFLAFGNMASDDFSTGINGLRWDVAPAGQVTASSGAVQLSAPNPTFDFPVANGWRFVRRAVGGDARQAQQIGKVVWQTSKTSTEAGVFFGDAGHGNYVLLGVRDVGATYHIFLDSVVAGVTSSSIDIANTGVASGGGPQGFWLHLSQTTTDGTWEASWSIVSATAGFTAPVSIVHPTTAHWAGFYLRSIATTVGAATVVAKADDHILWAPFSTAPFNAYVLLDRALGFAPDVLGARSAIAQIKHAFVAGTFITTPALLCDDPENGCDHAPCGGY